MVFPPTFPIPFQSVTLSLHTIPFPFSLAPRTAPKVPPSLPPSSQQLVPHSTLLINWPNFPRSPKLSLTAVSDSPSPPPSPSSFLSPLPVPLHSPDPLPSPRAPFSSPISQKSDLFSPRRLFCVLIKVLRKGINLGSV